MWQKPWRWVLAAVGGALVLGILNGGAQLAGAGDYFGLPAVLRVVVFIAVAALLNFVLFPAPPASEGPRRLPRQRQQQG